MKLKQRNGVGLVKFFSSTFQCLMEMGAPVPTAEEVRIWTAGPAPRNLSKTVTLKTEDTHPSSRDLSCFACKNTHVIQNKTGRSHVNLWWLNIKVSSGFALPLTHHISAQFYRRTSCCKGLGGQVMASFSFL